MNPGAVHRTGAYSEFTRNGARGSSIRTHRYRYVEWRDLKSQEVVARELYDHKNDPGENVSVADRDEFSEAIHSLSLQLSSRR